MTVVRLPLLAALALLAACSDTSGPVQSDTTRPTQRTAPISLDVVASTDSVFVSGAPLPLTAVVRDSATGAVIDTVPVTWSSSDTAVLHVDTAGKVTARNEGSAWIRGVVGSRAADSVRVRGRFARVGYIGAGTVQLSVNGFGFSTCGVDAAGVGQCWTVQNRSMYGTNLVGSAPIAGHTFRQVETAETSVCGLRMDGKVYCWGRNDFAVLGLGTTTPAQADVPTLAAGGRTFASLSVGQNKSVCGIAAADSVVYCWGKHDAMQTGREPANTRDSSVAPVAGSLRATQVSLGYFHGCAIGVDTATWCWGMSKLFGPDAGLVEPTQVAAPGTFTRVSAGALSTCALDANGAASCWGEAVRDATAPDASARAPRRVGGAPALVALTAGEDMGCGLTAGGALYCWRYRVAAEPAREMIATRFMPTRTFRAIAGTFNSTNCAVATSGETYCW